MPMARQWLRKPEIDKWPWRGDHILESTVAGSRTATAAEWLVKIFVLVFVNTLFLLAALHLLHSGIDLDGDEDPRSCITSATPTSTRPSNLRRGYLSTEGMSDSTGLTLKNTSNLINIRHFETHGVAVHLFIKMSAHRGGPNTFVVIGLEAKNPAELYSDPPYECVWIPATAPPTSTSSTTKAAASIKGHALKMLPDTGNTYSRLYSAVIVNCTFRQPVGVDRQGGQLVVYASYGEVCSRKPERIVVLTEVADEYKGVEAYESQEFAYEYVYCGSPLFGNLSPQRIREWLAYHMHFFGPRSHFFMYDAGGVHADVRRVLNPWIEAGRVTLDDIREQEKFDGYYHNQFMVVNDCFHRARQLSRWLFFFDVDEYMWIPPTGISLSSILAGYENQTQIIIWQRPMSRNLCAGQRNVANDTNLARKWALEKLVFHNIRERESYDCKYAIQPRKAMATGIHRSGHLIGSNATMYADPLNYYHYHNTINKREEVCQEFIDPGSVYVNPKNKDDKFVYDDGIVVLVEHIKEFEMDAIGPQPFII